MLSSCQKGRTDRNNHDALQDLRHCIVVTRHASFRAFLPSPPPKKKKKTLALYNKHLQSYLIRHPSAPSPQRWSTCCMLPSKSSASVHPSHHSVAVRIAPRSDCWRRRRAPPCARVRKAEEQNVQNTLEEWIC